jgi:hypothetical protein
MSAAGRAFIILAAICLAMTAGSAAAQADPSLEYRVKANFLVRFAAFVTWPPSAFSSREAPLMICVAGRDPFGAALDQAASGQSAHARAIAVRRLRAPGEAMGCHILYAAPGSDPAYRLPILGRLVVTEAGDAGAIAFHLRDGRVRFSINLVSARPSGLTMSSRLLDLAISVRER